MTKIKTARLLLLKFISERMSETGVSQLKLSELTGINQANLSKILSGKNTPTLDTFIKLCQALEIRIFLESKTEDKKANEARVFLNEILERRKGKK
ncbi:MAG: helix-turn-helix transcriptional regulator [Saprospiraceae bacterium]|nr:helix-turn-helix transcriptional regulator [Saprospiraceae bacterium]